MSREKNNMAKESISFVKFIIDFFFTYLCPLYRYELFFAIKFLSMYNYAAQT